MSSTLDATTTTTTGTTSSPAAATTIDLDARPDATVPPDAEPIIERALREEGPPPIKGVWRLDERELRFQRRVTALLTIAPLAGVVAAIVLLWGTGISGLDLGLFLGLYVFTGLGITVGYHRLFTHRSFEAPAPVRAIIAIAGSMAVQGSVISWVADHRRHHAFADEYGDPHSPHLVEYDGLKGVLYGLWHAHIGWFLDGQVTSAQRWAPDLLEDDVLVRVDRAFPALTVATFVLPALIGGLLTMSVWGAVTAFIWGALVRVFLLHHVTWSINSICHFYGQRPFDARDESRNNRWIAVLAFGEGWHNNHHAFPTSARHGILRLQLDPSWRVIRTLEQLRLATNVRRVSERMLERRWREGPRSLARG